MSSLNRATLSLDTGASERTGVSQLLTLPMAANHEARKVRRLSLGWSAAMSQQLT